MKYGVAILALYSDEIHVPLSCSRNIHKRDALVTGEALAQALLKDLARRIQTLRKERGYNPTDILAVASILDLDEESLEMMQEKSKDLAFLVRVKNVNFEQTCQEYKDDDIDGQKIRISVE